MTPEERGEGVARIGTTGVVRFKVPELPDSEPLTSDALDTLIEPVTRPREVIEQQLRTGTRTIAPEPVTDSDAMPTSPSSEEGHHDW